MVAISSRQPRSVELVAVFDAESVMRQAIDELRCVGLDPAELSVALPSSGVDVAEGRSLNCPNLLVDKKAPREVQIDLQSMGILQGALISTPVYVCASIMSAAAALNGASLVITIAAATTGCCIGALIGALLLGRVKQRRSWRVKQYLDQGGLALLVPIRGPENEALIREILAQHRTLDNEESRRRRHQSTCRPTA